MTYANKAGVTAIGIIFPVLALLSFGLRTWGWRRDARKLEVDDILIVPATFLTIAAGAALVIGAQMNIIGGHSLPGITPTEAHNMGKFEYAFWIGHVLAIGFIKLSLLFLFRRLFKGHAKTIAFDYANWLLIVLVSLWTVVFLFFVIFSCGSHPAAIWTSLFTLRHDCIDTFSTYTGFAVFSWVLDLAILVEPLFVIGRLNMGLRRKLQVSLVFVFSTFAVVAGLLRMIIWIQVKVQGSERATTRLLGLNVQTADQEALVSIALFWTYVEIGVGFLVACIPPCARHLDVSLGLVMSRLRSMSSTHSLPKKGSRGSSFDKNRHADGSQEQASHASSPRPKQSKDSSNMHIEDEIELYKLPSRA